jgi:Putative peptidoglycan binding domain
MRLLSACAITLFAALVLAASSVAAFELSSWNRIKPGVFVLDVPVGGLTTEEAQQQIAPRALAILDQPLQIQLNGSTWSTSARQLGVALDPQVLARNAYAVGRESSPAQALEEQLKALQSGHQVNVAGEVNGMMVDALVKRIAQ